MAGGGEDDHPHLVVGQPQRLRELELDVPDALGGFVDGQPLAVPVGDAAAGLDVDVELRRHLVDALDDHVGLGEAALEVAGLPAILGALHVALAHLLDVEHGHEGRARLHGLARGGDRGQDFVLDLDEAEGLAREVEVAHGLSAEYVETSIEFLSGRRRSARSGARRSA